MTLDGERSFFGVMADLGTSGREIHKEEKKLGALCLRIILFLRQSVIIPMK